MSRYKKIKNAKGLYKDQNGNFYAQKRVHKKLYSSTFNTLKEAKAWVKEFHPDHKKFILEPTELNHFNGSKEYVFKDMWKEYKDYTEPGVEKSTLVARKRMEVFVNELMDIKLKFFNPDLISQLVLKNKELAIKNPKSRRMNFNFELSHLGCFFSWYIREKDFYFKSPIIARRHSLQGIIKKKIKNDKRMNIEHIQQFLSSLNELNEIDGLYYKFAVLQFLTASRAQDIAAIHDFQIDLKSKELLLDRAIAWTRDKTIGSYVKEQKNKQSRICSITPLMSGILKNLLKNKLKSKEKDLNGLLFHLDGNIISYGKLRHAYNRGLEHAGLSKWFKSTHIMRRSMAKLAREEFGSIDAVQAMTGHKDVRMAEHYSGRNDKLQKQVANEIDAILSKNIQKSLAKSCKNKKSRNNV
ncbi:MAG: putative integrase [Prokaryotic dsDNA virus sp.]|nr:MAG: putative integrase [Prokaryotic dsDNA virus sp.]|tara:strand:- start:28474 stop:29706 length:1233 start_codon:yes stop_codon:yes gene_type:complete